MNEDVAFNIFFGVIVITFIAVLFFLPELFGISKKRNNKKPNDNQFK